MKRPGLKGPLFFTVFAGLKPGASTHHWLLENINSVFALIAESRVLTVKRIDDFQKRKSVETGIARGDATDAMLAHQDRGMHVMEYVAGQVREFRNDLSGNFRVPLRMNEDT